MDSAMYVALSAQVALERRLDTIAQNVANAATAGYRAEEIKFDAVLYKVGLSNPGADPTAFVSAGDTYLSRRAGRSDEDRQPARCRRAGTTAGSPINTPRRRRLYARRTHADAGIRRPADA